MCFWRLRGRFTPYSFKLKAELNSLQFWRTSTADLHWAENGIQPPELSPSQCAFPFLVHLQCQQWCTEYSTYSSNSFFPGQRLNVYRKPGTSLFQGQLTGNFYSFSLCTRTYWQVPEVRMGAFLQPLFYIAQKKFWRTFVVKRFFLKDEYNLLKILDYLTTMKLFLKITNKTCPSLKVFIQSVNL